MNVKLATLVVVTSACLAAASTAGASRAAQVCPTFKQGKLTYHLETLGTRWRTEGGGSVRCLSSIVPGASEVKGVKIESVVVTKSPSETARDASLPSR